VHAVQQINRNIDLMRYGCYGDSLRSLELVNATTGDPVDIDGGGDGKHRTYKTFVEFVDQSPLAPKDRYETLRAFRSLFRIRAHRINFLRYRNRRLEDAEINFLKQCEQRSAFCM
jgi:hypothetical protein